MELCRIVCFIFFFLYFCSYKIAAGNSLYHEKQLFFKVFCYCCLYKVAAEQKARTTYDNILRLVKDPEVCEPIRFLREREIVHYQRFGETNREDCNKNLKVSKAHNYGTFEQILTIRKFTGRRHKPLPLKGTCLILLTTLRTSIRKILKFLCY